MSEPRGPLSGATKQGIPLRRALSPEAAPMSAGPTSRVHGGAPGTRAPLTWRDLPSWRVSETGSCAPWLAKSNKTRCLQQDPFDFLFWREMTCPFPMAAHAIGCSGNCARAFRALHRRTRLFLASEPSRHVPNTAGRRRDTLPCGLPFCTAARGGGEAYEVREPPIIARHGRDLPGPAPPSAKANRRDVTWLPHKP